MCKLLPDSVATPRLSFTTQAPLKPSSATRKVRFRVSSYTYFEPGREQELALDRKDELFYTSGDYDRVEDEAEETTKEEEAEESEKA